VRSSHLKRLFQIQSVPVSYNPSLGIGTPFRKRRAVLGRKQLRFLLWHNLTHGA
jgi:hypothetical protein